MRVRLPYLHSSQLRIWESDPHISFRRFEAAALGGGIFRRERQGALRRGGDRLLAFPREHEAQEFARDRIQWAGGEGEKGAIERVAPRHRSLLGPRDRFAPGA